MVDITKAAQIVASLPGVSVGVRYGNRTWLVGEKGFAWERPFSKADLRRFGDAPVPSGSILAVRVADLRAKEEVLAAGQRGVFTIPHFDGYAAVLIQLERVTLPVLRRLVTDAWLATVPPSLVDRAAVQRRRVPGRRRP